MAITIHQATCGEQNKAWGLLNTTLDDYSLAKKIAFQTDLQDSPPSGFQWLPVIRGFIFGDYFLLIKTYPDNSPDVRNGRVFSHCLIIDKLDLQSISDLSPLLTRFKTKLDKTIQLEPIILTPDQQEKVVLKDSLRLRFNKVIQSFIRFTNNYEPIVWVGQKHFDIAVCKLWQLLSYTQRDSFYFGINFNPSEVAKDKMSFVVILDNSENKFDNKGFTIIRREDSVELKEFSEQFLAGETNATSRIEKFVSAIEANKPSIKDISTITKGVPTFENLNKEKDLKMLNTLSNIVAKYSPNECKGTAIKSKLVERISLLAEKADNSDIFLLRNFPTKSFKGSEKRISLSIDKWCSDFLFNEKQNQKVNYVPFIVQVIEAPQSNWIVTLISRKISNFLSDVSIVTARIIWLWITNDAKILKNISNEIEITKTAEKNIYEALRKANDSALSEVKSFAVSRNWFRLFATIVRLQYDFETAIKEQLKVDSNKNYFEGIEVITEGVKPKEIIALSVSNGDDRCIYLSGKLCKKNPKLLADLQIENTNWQEVWLGAINNGNKVSDGIKEPQKIIHILFDLLIDGKSVNEKLLEKISETDFADVLSYPNRNMIWAKLPSKIKAKFLEKTSSTLLESLSNNSTYPVPDDNDLSNYILSNAISVFLYHNRHNIKNVLPIFNTFEQIHEHIIRDYISNYSGKIDVVDATQLGQLVSKRSYRSVANSISQKTYFDKKYKVALAECYELLDIITKGIAWASGLISKIEIAEDDWWNAFVPLSYNLYSGGPTENKIWSQAEGKEYDLLTKGTGREVWIAALKKLREKNCTGDITVKRLLKVMLDENKKNKELRTLKELWKKL